jgi:hypothetical protein
MRFLTLPQVSFSALIAAIVSFLVLAAMAQIPSQSVKSPRGSDELLMNCNLRFSNCPIP